MTIASDIHADLITPLGAYLRLAAEGGAAFLLESVEKGRLGRYSLVGRGTRIVDFAGAERALISGSPVAGYLAYDHIAELEPTVPLPDEGAGLPESRLRRRLDARPLRPRGERRRGSPRRQGRCRGPPSPGSGASPKPSRRPRRHDSLPRQADYEQGVRRAKEYIRDGDAFQIVFTEGGATDGRICPRALPVAPPYHPSPYHFLLDLDGMALVGSSPETLVKLEGTRASLNPIAGTSDPGEGDAEELLASEKDRAEHIMLVDLGRNDLSRVCKAGTVRVGKFLEPERYSHVTHLGSEVAGELLPGTGPFDLLRACFPAGTVSGAPKVRAMQIISELEGYRRGPYAGAVGYALPGGSFDTCIAIRTVVLEGGVARLQAGAGIVADSDPAAEHEECLRKLAALEAALEEAEAA
jgi:anthranilate synthase component 1